MKDYINIEIQNSRWKTPPKITWKRWGWGSQLGLPNLDADRNTEIEMLIKIFLKNFIITNIYILKDILLFIKIFVLSSTSKMNSLRYRNVFYKFRVLYETRFTKCVVENKDEKNPSYYFKVKYFHLIIYVYKAHYLQLIIHSLLMNIFIFVHVIWRKQMASYSTCLIPINIIFRIK